MSASPLGTPPPIPTISPNRNDLKADPICVATAVAGLLPIKPAGRQTMTILWPPCARVSKIVVDRILLEIVLFF